MSESACAPVAADRIVITFPDGKTRDYTTGVTGAEIADSIAKSLAKAAIAVKIDGVLSDLSLPISHAATVAIVKREVWSREKAIAYPQDDDVIDIIEDLALYCPSGGGYFYDETHIKRKLLSLIKKYL